MPVYSNQRRLKYVAPPSASARPHDLRHRVGELPVALLARALERGELLLVEQRGLLLQLLALLPQLDEDADLRAQDSGSMGLKM